MEVKEEVTYTLRYVIRIGRKVHEESSLKARFDVDIGSTTGERESNRRHRRNLDAYRELPAPVYVCSYTYTDDVGVMVNEREIENCEKLLIYMSPNCDSFAEKSTNYSKCSAMFSISRKIF